MLEYVVGLPAILQSNFIMADKFGMFVPGLLITCCINNHNLHVSKDRNYRGLVKAKTSRAFVICI